MVLNKPAAAAHAAMEISSLPERTALPPASAGNSSKSEELKQLIQEVTADLNDLQKFYSISFSPTKIQRIGEHLAQRRNELQLRFVGHFDDLDQEGKVDWHLLRVFLGREIELLRADWDKIEELSPLLGTFVPGLIDLCERRQKVIPTNGKDAAKVLNDAGNSIKSLCVAIKDRRFNMKHNRFAAYRAAQELEELHAHLTEWYGFYKGYDPLFTWWTTKPWEDLSAELRNFIPLIRDKLVGIQPGDADAIVGQPIQRAGIFAELEAEMIPYSPEELIQLGEQEYSWCEKEAIAASQQMGFGSDWRKAQEHVKNMYVEPGQQIHMVHGFAQEAIDYVTKRDMVTIPPIAKESWRTIMMTPARQKVNPFFLGGSDIIVSYPTDTMSHEDKIMVMRGNNRPFSRSTVFHELIPGHHLQYHYMDRHRPYRKQFQTPLWIEGWAFYWEMILWDRNFPETPENKIGMLFWRMHRCARIIFSLNFHLGKWTPQQCIDYLVEKVGHERATAEGEVRRSFNGDYGALYQAGYMLGALQLYALRREIVDQGNMTEKQFHDRVLRENNMPIELLRALLKDEKLEIGFKPSWRFYDL